MKYLGTCRPVITQLDALFGMLCCGAAVAAAGGVDNVRTGVQTVLQTQKPQQHQQYQQQKHTNI
jgi:hypothetical protein